MCPKGGIRMFVCLCCRGLIFNMFMTGFVASVEGSYPHYTMEHIATSSVLIARIGNCCIVGKPLVVHET
jgi:hypothetical protein